MTLPTPLQLPPADPAEVAAVLRNAAAELRRRGWARSELMSVDGRVCAMQAINEGNVHDRFSVQNDAAERAADLLPSCPCPLCKTSGPRPVSSMHHEHIELVRRLIHFNDLFAESGNEVAVLFEQAAEKIEAGL